jgi:DNA-binding NtrC family response regulator
MPASILHVEDDTTFAIVLPLVLPGRFPIVTVSTLADAVVTAMRGNVRGCILDLNLPDSSGLSTLRRFRAQCQIPVIVVTGIDDDQMAVHSFRMGAAAFFTKVELMTGQGQLRLAEELDRHVLGIEHADDLMRLSRSVYRRVMSVGYGAPVGAA